MASTDLEEIREALRNAISGRHPRISDIDLLYYQMQETIKFSQTRKNEVLQKYNKSKIDYENYLSDKDSAINEDYALELSAMEKDKWEHLTHFGLMEAHHNMNCIANIAPLIECIFIHTFGYIRENKDTLSKHHRWDGKDRCDDKDRWDCHYYYPDNKKPKIKNISKGIPQLLEAIGIRKEFPEDMDKTLTALFAYRNSMFHNGYEWPIKEKEDFIKKANKEKWESNNEEWFECGSADSGIIPMSDSFIEESMDFARTIIDITIAICDKLHAEKGCMEKHEGK